MPDSEPDLTPLCDADPLARRALAALRPARPAVDPLRVAYLAGEARRGRDAAFWRRMFAAQCAVTGGLAAALTWFLVATAGPDADTGSQPTASVPKAVPRPPAPESAPMPRPAPDVYVEPVELFAREPVGETNTAELAEYLRVRSEVLAAGLSLLPESKAAARPPVSAAELERSLQLSPGVLTAPYRLPPPPKANEPE